MGHKKIYNPLMVPQHDRLKIKCASPSQIDLNKNGLKLILFQLRNFR